MTDTMENRQHPETMDVDNIIGELIFIKESKDRKKLLLEAINNKSVETDNIDSWLKGFKMCQEKDYFPSHVIMKIKKMINFIETTTDKDLLTEICKSTDLPKEITAAACFRSKIENQIKNNL